MFFTNLIILIIQKQLMKKYLDPKLAQEINSVAWNDNRNFQGLREYLKLALTSMAAIQLEWSASDILVFIAGLISV